MLTEKQRLFKIAQKVEASGVRDKVKVMEIAETIDVFAQFIYETYQEKRGKEELKK